MKKKNENRLSNQFLVMHFYKCNLFRCWSMQKASIRFGIYDLVLIMHRNSLSLFLFFSFSFSCIRTHFYSNSVCFLFLLCSGEFGSFTFILLKDRFVWVCDNVHLIDSITQNRLHTPNHNEDTETRIQTIIYSFPLTVYIVFECLIIILSGFVRFSDIGLLFIREQ